MKLPNSALPQGDESVVVRCYSCRFREAVSSVEFASRLWREHREVTGHDVGTIFGRGDEHSESQQNTANVKRS